MAGFLLSHELWIDTRSYPLTPVLRCLKSIGFPFDYAVFTTLLLLLALIVVASRPTKLIAGFVSLAVVWALFDQARWQPWFYQYLFMLAAIGLSFKYQTNSEKQRSALDACRLIVVSVYFWSGIQKANAGFVHTTFPFMLEPFARFLPSAAKGWLYPLGVIAPLVEPGIAIGLLTRRFRTTAVIAAVALHLFILASVGPWGRDYNDVVWPWNVAMSAFVVLLFWRTEEVRPREVLWANRFAFQKLVLVLFGLAPALGVFNLWDSYLSFALYSGNRNTATIYMASRVVDKLPDDAWELVTEDESKVDRLVLSDWSLGVLHVPPYPEIRIFKSIGRVICGNAVNPSDVKLVVQGKTTWLHPGRQFTYDCASLTK